MALNKLKKWIGTQAMTAFFDQLNDNVDATNAAIDLAEQSAAGLASRDVLWQGSAGESVSLQLTGNAEDYAFIVFYTSSEVASSTNNGIAFAMPGIMAHRLACTYGNAAANFRYESTTNNITVYHFSNADMRVKKVEGVVKVR